ncbi:NACHT, LRR and PYD domains-containing protein 1b allele 3-like [Myripristis murdjan]|uniref:NACHT, LRR and PYD domains-containing protein 1b allele 3-like n=1 Tax=Myripristis murdjan TaxID=586833 RepID=UPI001175FF9F|nr:NACHT, LRR and PYD domains-containing protein 1b allele 3-like [Myripristis murdjan]
MASSSVCAPSSNITLSDSAQEASEPSSSPKPQSSLFQSCEGPEEQSAEVLTPQNRNATDDGSLPFHTPTSTLDVPTSSVTGPPCPENSRRSLMDSSVSTAEDTLMDLCRFEFSGLKSQLGENHDAPEEKVPPVTASPPSATDTMPASSLLPFQRSGESSVLSCSRSMPSLSETPSTRNRKHTHRKRSQSLPDVTSQDSFKRFTPEISDDENSEIYRFQCTSPGLYQCSVTGLVFNMKGEGDVTYRIVHWDRRLLAQHHKKPAGPLFDIRCQQQSVCQLHLPHCEIRSTGACQFLSVAHVTDEGTDFILPHEITETHAVIEITGFSKYGIVKEEDSPPGPIRAVVLLFYIPPVDPDPTSFLHVLLLPGNIVIRDVQYKRRERNADERYIETPPHCKLQPNQEYMLSTSPEDESVLIQPKKQEFDNEINDNYFTTFEVVLHQIMKNINLLLRESNSSHCVWERQVSLSSATVRKPLVQRVVGLHPDKHLLSIRKAFIDRVSGPVLQSLLDRLLEKQVINDSEKEAADAKQSKHKMASFVIDMVRKKGERASSQMITFLRKEDKYLSESLGLMVKTKLTK